MAWEVASSKPVLVCCPGGWKGERVDSKETLEETVMGLATDGWGRVESREAEG